MSNLIPISTYNLALAPFKPAAVHTEDYPVTVRLTLAAVDPEAVDDKEEPSTLRLLKRNNPFFGDDDSEEDSEEDELDLESESEEEEAKPEPKKSNKKSKKEQKEEETVDIENSDDAESDEDPDDDVSEFVVCTLTPKIQFQQTIDLTICPDEQVYFVVTGSYPIHLVGNYIEHPADEDSEDEDEDDYDYDDEDDYDLTPDEDEVYGAPQYDLDDLEDESDVENKIEELVEDEQNGKKRSSPSSEESDSKKAKKANNKKDEKKQVQFTKELEQGPTGSTLVGDKEEAKEQPKSKKQLKKERQQQQKKEAEEAAAADKAEKDDKKPEAKKFPTKTLLGGVITEDRKIGKGQTAKSGNKVGIRYIGKLKNGKVFDKNTSGKPFVFGLGKGECIKGFDLGVTGMAVGGERRVVIPPKMGYGSQALPGLPANSELTFDIKLVSLK